MPIYVRAGSILPMGSVLQYTGERKNDTLEVRIYSGNDAQFTLYEDEGDSYNYEKGLFSEINFRWNDVVQNLTIEKRQGEFPGMLKQRCFRIVVIGKEIIDKPGYSGAFIKQVTYDGSPLVVDASKQ